MKIVSFDIGEKNFAYCVGKDGANIEISQVYYYDLLQRKRQTVVESCMLISSILLNDFDVTTCDTILIEQQMRANVRAQRIAQHVWTFFHTMNEMKGGAKQIIFVPAHLKTQKFIGKNTLGPKQRKAWAIEQIIGENSVLDGHAFIKSKIREMKKKDDVCDSILQLIAFCK